MTTDPTYLAAEKMSERDIAGVIGVSGVYRIPEGKLAVAFGGDAGNSFRFDEICPMRSKCDLGKPTEGPGLALAVDIFSPAFGDDPKFRQSASPVVHARPGLPPFLLINADHDLPTLADMSKEFAAVLAEHGVDARRMTAENRNHNTVMFRAIEGSDPVARRDARVHPTGSSIGPRSNCAEQTRRSAHAAIDLLHFRRPRPSGRRLGCRMTDITIWHPVEPVRPEHFEVVVRRDVPYRDGPDADKMRNSLDLYLPKGAKDFPVLVLVHGGAWVIGDNRCCGLYPSIADFLAKRGIGVVMPNYRLSPWVQHPEHVKDVARAIAWWTRSHLVANTSGHNDKLFLAGHSAGGHPRRPRDDRPGLHLRAARSCPMPTSPASSASAASTGFRKASSPSRSAATRANSFRLDEVTPAPRANRDLGKPAEGSGIPLNVDIFRPAFGDSASARQSASPVAHARPGLPPFPAPWQRRPPICRPLADMSKEFTAAVLTEHGVSGVTIC